MALLVPPGVFAPHSDSDMLASAIGREELPPESRVLDLGTGSGVLALAAARRGAEVTAVDVSRWALAAAWANVRRHGCRVHLRRGSLFAPVSGERFDLIVSNPPYVPCPDPALPRRGRARAWAAGRDGRLVLDGICAGARRHLRPGGAILLVHSSLIGEAATLDGLVRGGLVAPEVVDRSRGPVGPLIRAQQHLGTISGSLAEEDLVVIRAHAPARS